MKVFVDPKSMLYLDGMTLDWQGVADAVGLRVRESECEEELRLRNVVFGVIGSYYELFGIPRKLESRSATICKKRFYELSRQWHPDRFTRRAASEQQNALDATAMLNDAYRTLRDPRGAGRISARSRTGSISASSGRRTFRRSCWKKSSS